MTTICPGCHAVVREGARFCISCGTHLDAPAPPSPAQTICPACGAQHRPEARFCTGCGRPFAEARTGLAGAGAGAASAPSASGPVQFQPQPPVGYAPMPPMPVPVPIRVPFAAHPVQPAVPLAAPYPAYAPSTPHVPMGVPPATAPSPFQVTLSQKADAIVASLAQSGFAPGTRQGTIAERVIRTALLDPRAYRQIAEDDASTGDAWLVLLGASFAGTAGMYLLGGGLTSIASIASILIFTAVQAFSFVAAVFAITKALPSLAGVTLDFGKVFRAVAYAQAPGVLGFIPALGSLLGLWRLPTTVVALTSITGCTTGKAVGLLIVGLIGSLIASAIASPLLFAVLRG